MVIEEEAELLEEFRTESLEHLDASEPLVVSIEQLAPDARHECVNRIFRAVHSVKGAAGFFELDTIQRLAHALESLLMPVRDGTRPYRSAMTDALLSSFDKMRRMIEALPDRLELPIEAELAQLERAAAETAEAPTAAAASHGETPTPMSVASEAEALTARAPDPVPDSDRDSQADSDLDSDRVGAMGANGSDAVSDSPSESASLSAEATAADVKRDPTAASEATRSRVAPDDATPEPLDGEFRFDDVRRTEAQRFGQSLFVVRGSRSQRTRAELRAALAQVGEILAERESRSRGAGCDLLVASVLERDLLAAASGLPADAVSLYEGQGQAVAQSALPARPSHASESSAAEPSTAPAALAHDSGADTIRVPVPLLDKLMNLAGELVLVRNQLLSRFESEGDPDVNTMLQNVNLVTSELQTHIMNTRMQPVSGTFSKFHRIVRDLSRKLGKKTTLEIDGAEVELDKSILELLSDPLTHLIRNALDHGLEPPQERLERGKPEMGRIWLRAYHEGGQVNLEIRDDGRGIDPNRLREVAVKRGLCRQAQADELSDDEALQLIFAPGFSTAKAVSDVSGRGVGMDVVSANIAKIGGKVEIDTELGRGTQFRIRLPLTLAILPSLIVGLDQERFAVPQVNLIELVRVTPRDLDARVHQVNGAPVLRLRGELLPLVHLADVIGWDDSEIEREHRWNPSAGSSSLYVLVLRAGDDRYGLVVDRVWDSEEIVVKPLSQFLQGCRPYAGATIMGDGRVALILDVAGIASEAGLRFDSQLRREPESSDKVHARTETREVVLFEHGPNEYFAIDVRQIARLEKIDATQIERSGGDEMIQYRGRALPLLRLDRVLEVAPISAERAELHVLIPRASARRHGVLTGRVVDIVLNEGPLEKVQEASAAIEGRAIVQGHITLFLKAAQILEQVGAA